jgi:hypothetical protein
LEAERIKPAEMKLYWLKLYWLASRPPMPHHPANCLESGAWRLWTLEFRWLELIKRAHGPVLQNAANAGGFFLGKTNAGSISLQPPAEHR